MFLKISQISRETPVFVLLFNKSCCLLERDTNAGVSCEIREIFKSTYFEEHLRTTASTGGELVSY